LSARPERRRALPSATAGGAVVLLLAAMAAAGCGPRRLEVRPLRYEIDVDLRPPAHALDGRVTVELATEPPRSRAKGALELQLHPDLDVATLEVTGATLRRHRTRPGRGGDPGQVRPTTHRLVLTDLGGSLRVTLSYSGALFQDVAAGEKEGEIHNLQVSAHVGEEGLYLDRSGYWYPRLPAEDDADPARGLSHYALSVTPVAGFELVAGLERAGDGPDGRLRWSSPFPLEGLVLLGGPHRRLSRRHGDVTLHAVLPAGKEAVAQDILDASAEYLDRYEPLVGPYPFREFTVLEAFFSSGFAFPAVTQIAGSQLSEYKQYRRHGYLDHELLHNWWGNGVLVDPRDGNWCEGLASWAGNYYGFVLDGDAEGARKQRRNLSNFLSDIAAEDDLPLDTFGRPGGVGRGTGYGKGAAVFHMLERRIGPEAFFAGLRQLTEERMGAHADWAALRAAFEQASGSDLGRFFDEWVHGRGAPALDLVHADWRPGRPHVAVTLSQGATAFDLDVPLRLYFGERTEDVTVRLDRSEATVEVPCATEGLTAVELDPDFHVFRKLKIAEVMPTSSLTRGSSKLRVVTPPGELEEGYRTALRSYRQAVLGDEAEGKTGHVLTVTEAGAATDEQLALSGVLVLGDAVRAPAVARLLERAGSPVRFGEGAFEVGGQSWGGAGEAVFFTVHHPDLAGEGITVYYGNGPAALANARVLSFYPNSLLVFRTPLDDDDADPSEMPRSEVMLRLDFESHNRINF
jgi:hypothetical protein